MNTSNLRELLETLTKDGKIVTVDFVKKDGSLRTLTGRTKVTKHLQGGITTYTANPNNFGIWEMSGDGGKENYRCFNLERVVSIKGRGFDTKVQNIEDIIAR